MLKLLGNILSKIFYIPEVTDIGGDEITLTLRS